MFASSLLSINIQNLSYQNRRGWRPLHHMILYILIGRQEWMDTWETKKKKTWSSLTWWFTIRNQNGWMDLLVGNNELLKLYRIQTYKLYCWPEGSQKRLRCFDERRSRTQTCSTRLLDWCVYVCVCVRIVSISCVSWYTVYDLYRVWFMGFSPMAGL